jgi:hypothetical protein
MAQDFGQLYRAAFAETDPDRKVVLLGQVRKAIEQWERMIDEPFPAASVKSKSDRIADLRSA